MLHIQVTGWRPVVVHDHFLLHCFRALLLSDHLCQNTLRLKGSPTKIQNARPVISPFLLPRNKVREVRGGSGVRDNVANTILVLDNEKMRQCWYINGSQGMHEVIKQKISVDYSRCLGRIRLSVEEGLAH